MRFSGWQSPHPSCSINLLRPRSRNWPVIVRNLARRAIIWPISKRQSRSRWGCKPPPPHFLGGNVVSPRFVTSIVPTVADVLIALDEHAPRAAAFDWDNPGLQVGDPTTPVTSAVVALDPSLAAISFARDLRADLLLTHHPLLFSATKQLDLSRGVGERVGAAIAGNVAVIAAHTDWDLASPGLNDALAMQLGLADVTPFGRGKDVAMLRLVTYVPEGAADRLLDALAEAGAGTIGHYRRCGFWNHGEG
ncbi:MAG: hypothetical protein C4320_06890, partial [Armatimonadota bacterium]